MPPGPGGIQLLDPVGRPTNAQLVSAQLASPLNDTQMICLMASEIAAALFTIPEINAGAVDPVVLAAEHAFRLFAEVVVRDQAGYRNQCFAEARKRHGFTDPRDEPAPAPTAPAIVTGEGGV